MLIVWAAMSFGLSPDANADPEILEEIHWLPADVDFVLAVRDMNKVRQMPLGMGVTELVKTGLTVGGARQSATLKAWRTLSERLGMTEEQAFGALLGERFFCASRMNDDGGSDWVMYSRTSTRIARQIRKKLDVSPREIKNERVLMTLEGGAFRLGSLIDRDEAWLMLAPTDRDGLFQQIADGGPDPDWPALGRTRPMQEFRTLGDGQLAVYMTFGDGAADGWFGLVAEAENDSVSFRMLSDPGKPLPPIAPWSTAVFDELRDGSVYAHIERLPAGEAMPEQQNTLDGFGAMLGDLRRFLEIPHRMLGKDLELILGNRFALCAHSVPGVGLSVGVGVEASDVKALATPGDAAMRSIVDSTRLFYGAREAEFNFVGRLPRAVRGIKLVPSEPGEGHGHQFERGLPPFGEELAFNWSFRDTVGQAPMGWWVVGTDKPSFERTARALTGTDEGLWDERVAPWLVLIDAHPAALMDAIHRGGVPRSRHLSGIERLDSLWLKTWIDGGGDLVVGEGSIRITEPPGRRRGQRLRGR